MIEIIKGGSLAIILVMQEALRDPIRKFLGISPAISAVICLSLAITAYALIDRFLYLARRSKHYRAWKEKKVAATEGFWISKVTDTNAPFSISKIYYSKSRDRWVHHGYGYDSLGNKVREWRVFSIHFDNNSSEWFFSGDWWPHVMDSVLGDQNTRGSQKDQISIIHVPPNTHNHLVSLFLDEPRSAGIDPSNPQRALRDGRALMCKISRDRIYNLTAVRPNRIEDISSDMARKLFQDRDRIFEEYV